MAEQALRIENLEVVPFPDAVRARIEKAFEPLVSSSHLTLDFTGTTREAKYTITFEEKYEWSARDRFGCQRRPSTFGLSASIYVGAIRGYALCTHVTVCKACEPVFRHSPDELGKAIASVAVHEAGHVLGLMDEGSRRTGHSPDERNAMFTITLHRDYAPLDRDSKRTTKYRIVEGDTLLRIARRVGFWGPGYGWRTLFDLIGNDGRTNRSLLRSGRPDLIIPGEEIWVPDVAARIAWIRSVELADKAFNQAQLDAMRKWIDAGRTAFP